MEENKERKGLFLSGIIVGFAATLLIVGGIFIAFQIHNIVSLKDDVSAQVSYDEDSAVNAQTIKKLQLLEDTVKENFYLSEVTNEQLEDGMFRGLMDSLDDPYSEYYTAEELNALVVKNDYHLNTGFLSTPSLCPVLAQYGYIETAYRLLLQDTKPGWLYAVKKGATTIWETCD